jgi:hypothetical protein
MTKRTKREVDYGKGDPPDGEHCEICRHYIPISGEAPECQCVLGSVKWSAWCRLFHVADGATQRANRAARG